MNAKPKSRRLHRLDIPVGIPGHLPALIRHISDLRHRTPTTSPTGESKRPPRTPTN